MTSEALPPMHYWTERSCTRKKGHQINAEGTACRVCLLSVWHSPRPYEYIPPLATSRHSRHRRLKRHLILTNGPYCQWCGRYVDMETGTIDHILPTILGGSNSSANKCLSCARCNRKKSGTHPLAWIARILPNYGM